MVCFREEDKNSPASNKIQNRVSGNVQMRKALSNTAMIQALLNDDVTDLETTVRKYHPEDVLANNSSDFEIVQPTVRKRHPIP